jgi:methionine synthase I (cobalamin-dependent)
MYQKLAEKLKSRQLIILDGGTGTDIQAKGAPMNGDTWCAEVNITHPHIVELVHEDYIAAGAEVITANTFASSVLSFNYYKRDADVRAIDTAAVEAAKRAAKGRVPVAGSFSTMRPVHPGTDRTVLDFNWTEAEARTLFASKAKGLKDAGVDLIMMEMMRDTDYSVWATEMALETGLPVWVGFSIERDGQGRLTGFGREDQLLEDFLPRLVATGPQALSIMHSSPNDITHALPFVKAHWDGPLGVYPESGYYAAPDWNFVGIIPPDELVNVSREWQSQGVSLLGGCCGIGPDHIRALSKAFQ